MVGNEDRYSARVGDFAEGEIFLLTFAFIGH
jgi:hypothetical protein